MNRQSKAEVGDRATGSDRLLTVAKGGGFLAAGDLFNYGSRLVAALVLANILGAESYGLYTLSVSIGFLAASLGNIGLDSAMERYVAVFRNRGDEQGLRGTLQIGLGFTLLLAITTSAIVFFSAGSIARDVFGEPQATPLLRLLAFLVPFLMTTALLAAIVRAFVRMDYSAFAENFVQPLVRLVLIFLIALIGINEVIAMIILGVSYMTATLVLLGLFHRIFPQVLWGPPARREIKEIAFFSLPFWFSGLLTQIRKNVQPVFLGVYSSVANVGIFSIATSANLLSSIAIMATRKSLRPILAETLDEGDLDQTLLLYQTTTRWTLTFTLPSFLVIILFPTELMGLFGKSFTGGAAALAVLAWADLANASTGTCGALLDMSGFNKVKTINKVFQFTVTIGLNVLLIPQFGLMGAAAAVLISTIAIQIVRVTEVRILIGLHPYNLRILKPLFAAATAYAAGLGLSWVLSPETGMLAFAIDALGVAVVYVATLLSLGLTPEDRMVIQAAARRVRRSNSRSSERATVESEGRDGSGDADKTEGPGR